MPRKSRDPTGRSEFADNKVYKNKLTENISTEIDSEIGDYGDIEIVNSNEYVQHGERHLINPSINSNLSTYTSQRERLHDQESENIISPPANRLSPYDQQRKAELKKMKARGSDSHFSPTSGYHNESYASNDVNSEREYVGKHNPSNSKGSSDHNTLQRKSTASGYKSSLVEENEEEEPIQTILYVKPNLDKSSTSPLVII